MEDIQLSVLCVQKSVQLSYMTIYVYSSKVLPVARMRYCIEFPIEIVHKHLCLRVIRITGMNPHLVRLLSHTSTTCITHKASSYYHKTIPYVLFLMS